MLRVLKKCFHVGERTSRSQSGDHNQPSSSSAAENAAHGKVSIAPQTSMAATSSSSSTLPIRKFSYQELVAATDNFGEDHRAGWGGFGTVYVGRIAYLNKEVAIKKLNRTGGQGVTEFVVEVITLSKSNHRNLVNLVGYCADEGERLLVYEFMPLGALDEHIYRRLPGLKPLDWNTRMKIAEGIATGLRYLHKERNPPIIYRDMKTSNVLLDQNYDPKLSDFGYAREATEGEDSFIFSRTIYGTEGYSAPDYAITGQLTFKSDIYSLGIVLLELITGREVTNSKNNREEQSFPCWARMKMKDRENMNELADPLLYGKFPRREFGVAMAACGMCIQTDPGYRPDVDEVVAVFKYLASRKFGLPELSSRGRHLRVSSI